jgi:hypothetical protein
MPWEKLKFLDESHFRGRDLCRRKGLSAKGEQLQLIVKDSLDEALSVTLLLDRTQPDSPLALDFRVGSNTQWDFARFVVYLVQTGRLKGGLLGFGQC